MENKKVIEFLNKNDTFSNFTGIELLEMKDGKSKVKLNINKNNFNFMGYPHGGILYTLIDVAAGSAVLSYGYTCVTVNVNINFVNKTKEKILYGYGEVIKTGKNIAECRCKIKDKNENIICTALCTMHPLKYKIEEYIKEPN